MPIDHMLDPLDVTAIRRDLCTHRIGTYLYVFGRVVSTGATLRALAEGGAPAGTVVFAESQDTPGTPSHLNLYASVLLGTSLETVGIPGLTVLSSLALTDALWTLGAHVSVRAPNEVVTGGRQVAVSHVDVIAAGDRRAHLAIGIAVNVNAGRDVLAASDTSLSEHLGRPIDRNALAADYLNHLEKWIRRYRAQGPEVIEAAWNERDLVTVCQRRPR